MTGALELAKPYLWLALIAFVVGFASYLAVGGAPPALAGEAAAYEAPVSAPVSDDWNLPKEI